MERISRRIIFVIFIPSAIIFSLFAWFIVKENNCEQLLKEDDCKTEKAYSFYSKEHRLGNGSRAVSTGFYLEYEGEKYKITTKAFYKPIPIGTPILIRFSPKCPDCTEILWNSVVSNNGHQIRFINLEDKGYIFETTKL